MGTYHERDQGNILKIGVVEMSLDMEKNYLAEI